MPVKPAPNRSKAVQQAHRDRGKTRQRPRGHGRHVSRHGRGSLLPAILALAASIALAMHAR